ncbi:MAG TPA: thioredoxin family protein [Acidimicrobiia bacterium]|nr:thioredoxin family protein [Acidimicrobiia bacterium]
MAATSTMLPLGTEAPDFELPDFAGAVHRRDDFADAPALVVAFICNPCPYVVHIRTEWARVAKELQDRGVGVVAIAANDVGAYPQDGPKGMAEDAREHGYTFPYLFDETQQVAQAYRAACTPDFYVFDRDRKLVYRGQFDNSRPSRGGPVTGADLTTAVDAVLAGQPAPEDQRPSMGCNIKWKPGNEPDYYG